MELDVPHPCSTTAPRDIKTLPYLSSTVKNVNVTCAGTEATRGFEAVDGPRREARRDERVSTAVAHKDWELSGGVACLHISARNLCEGRRRQTACSFAYSMCITSCANLTQQQNKHAGLQICWVYKLAKLVEQPHRRCLFTPRAEAYAGGDGLRLSQRCFQRHVAAL